MNHSISSGQVKAADERPTRKFKFTAEELKALIEIASKEKERDLLKTPAQRDAEIRTLSAAPDDENQIINGENLLVESQSPEITFGLPEDMMDDSDDTRRIYKFSA